MMDVQQRNQQQESEIHRYRWTIVLVIFLILAVIVLAMIGCPSYEVYQQKKKGQAILAHAQSSREVAVAEARAKMESSTLLAQADTIRAHGIARSNEIIGQSLTNAYLHWFWIDNIDKSNNVLYIPTENGLPKFNIPIDQTIPKATKE